MKTVDANADIPIQLAPPLSQSAVVTGPARSRSRS
jgi:hypothetical protein